MTAKVSKKNSFSTLSYQVLWLGSGIRLPRTIPLGPFFTAIFEPMVFHHKISRLEILYSLITIAGLLCIFSFDARYRYGIMIGVAAAAVAALYAVFNNKVSADVRGRTSLFYQMAGGVVVLSAIIPIYLLSLQRYYAIPPFPNSGLLLQLKSVNNKP